MSASEPPSRARPDPSGSSVTRAPLPLEVAPFVRSMLPALRGALDHCAARPAALVLVHEGRDRAELPGALSGLPVGHIVAAHPLDRVRGLARLVAPAVAHLLAAPPRPYETWCLVIGPSGAGVVPIAWGDGAESTRR